ncbi:MAG: VWA domain-containing protein [Gemmatimonadetes bacterium]|nr:VWA domain-containing protein [Gemmatimonadota bacterium]MDA1102282.1 VWA domain-containing protein [Gemmatimonadota bacterium]
MFRFEDPLVLSLLLAIPALFWFRNRQSRRGATIRYSAVDAVRGAGAGQIRWAHRIPGLLRALALAAVVVALARPQTGITSENVRTEGIDIVLVLDVSSSMLAEDLEPNRLEAAKIVAADFVAGRRNDRMGLVAFAGQAFTQAPLTFDYGVVQSLLGELEIGMIEDGTAVGMGLATAVKRLQASDAASKVVILLTDGRSNRGEIGPITAAQMAQALGVRVYTIGAGSQGTARVPVQDPLGGTRYATMRVDIDEPTLQEVAALTGGRYFRATDTESLASIYAEIDELETTVIEIENFTQFGEEFPLPLALGFLLLMAELALAQTALRTLP